MRAWLLKKLAIWLPRVVFSWKTHQNLEFSQFWINNHIFEGFFFSINYAFDIKWTLLNRYGVQFYVICEVRSCTTNTTQYYMLKGMMVKDYLQVIIGFVLNYLLYPNANCFDLYSQKYRKTHFLFNYTDLFFIKVKFTYNKIHSF